MKDQNNARLLESLEQLPTSDLDAMLHSELEKEFPAEDTVKLILKVLREREVDFPVLSNPQIDRAWDKYQNETSKKTMDFKRYIIKAAIFLIICSLLLFSLSQETHAQSLLNRVAAWSESIFALFNQWNHDQATQEYVFQTEHSGLQKLYDAVTKLGITTPVVPMWIDDEYVLNVLDCSTSPVITKLLAGFVGNNKEAVFELNIYTDSIPREFHKNEAEAIPYENNGTTYYLFRNNNLWTVVWSTDNLECSIVIECQEEVLYQILDSIYVTRE